MGWWGCDIMDGDEPLDFKYDMYKKLKVKDPVEPSREIREKAFDSWKSQDLIDLVPKIVNGRGWNSKKDPEFHGQCQIGYQVMAWEMLECGAIISATLAKTMLTAIEEDDWANINTEDLTAREKREVAMRKEAIQNLGNRLKKYIQKNCPSVSLESKPPKPDVSLVIKRDKIHRIVSRILKEEYGPIKPRDAERIKDLICKSLETELKTLMKGYFEDLERGAWIDEVINDNFPHYLTGVSSR